MMCTTPLVRELVQLWEGLEYSNESVNYALDGRRLDVRVNVRVLPGHEEDWSRVLVSLGRHHAANAGCPPGAA